MKRKNPLILIAGFFTASLAATIIAWLLTTKIVENRLQEIFYLDSNNAVSWINVRFDTYLDILTGVQAFVENSNIVTHAELNNYLNRTQITQRYPGLRSVVYVQKVSSADKDSFIRKIKAENPLDPAYANYTIRVIDPNYQKEQEDYYPVVFTEGPNQEERLTALGYDLSSEKRRAETLFAARDTARPATTPLIRFVINPTNNGFGIILPVYQKGLPTDTASQLRQAFAGAIYAPFDINLFFDAILKPDWRDAFPHLDLEVYDQQSERPNEPLYDKDQSVSLTREPHRYAFITKQTLSVPNRRWEIITGSSKKFVAVTYWTPVPLIILISGALASFATLSFLLYQYRRHYI